MPRSRQARFVPRSASLLLGIAILLGLPTPSARADAAFLLGPGDRVAVLVFRRADLSGEFRVTPAGSLALPFLRAVGVAGLSLADAQVAIARRVREDAFLLDPKVSVELVEARPIVVAGAVSRPGAYPFLLGMTVLRAVAVAGGLRVLPSDDVSAALEMGQFREKLRQVQQTLGLAMIRRARLDAERLGRDDFTPPDEAAAILGAGPARDDAEHERALLQQRNNAFHSQLDILKSELGGFHDEITALAEQTASKQRESDLALQESKRVEELQRQGLAARDLRVNELQRLAAQIDAERSQINAGIARAREEIARVSETVNSLTNQRQVDLLTAIKDTDDTIGTATVSIEENRTALAQASVVLPSAAERAARGRQAVYAIERTDGEAAQHLPADPDTPLRPGDMVVIAAGGIELR